MSVSETLLANINIDISDATNKTVPSPKLSPLVPDKDIMLSTG